MTTIDVPPPGPALTLLHEHGARLSRGNRTLTAHWSAGYHAALHFMRRHPELAAWFAARLHEEIGPELRAAYDAMPDAMTDAVIALMERLRKEEEPADDLPFD